MNGSGALRTYLGPKAMPFWAIHAVALWGVLSLGWSWSGLALAIGSYYLRMFFVTAGYHRYFSHRTFKTSRVGQLLFAFLAQTSAQKGALWWASHHRWHHKKSDQPGDVHSVRQQGFWWAHIGWILSDEWAATDEKRVADLTRYPELRLLNSTSWQLVPAVIYAVVCLALGGWWGLTWGFFVSTVLLWHGTFTINSLAHVFGRRRYATRDDSRNSLVLALLTLGEGWHNNHHHFQASANQGFRWWEIDISYYLLLLLERIGVVWDVRRAPASVVEDLAPAVAPAPAFVSDSTP
jgi:stearoyl-CoA desaturase (Delta-9 desaturase)